MNDDSLSHFEVWRMEGQTDRHTAIPYTVACVAR